jgi:hypothetical protein
MPENDLLIINWLLTTKPDPTPEKSASVVGWKRRQASVLYAWSEPVDMAVAGGFLADCPAYAFAAGYWAALQRLLPDLPKDPVPALCISEKHGPHPAHIKCRLEKSGDQWLLNGKKHFITCGREAGLLLVAASTGTDPDGKNQLRLVRANRQQTGIAVKPLKKPLAILPEISHGMVEFSDVSVSPDDILPGDGYRSYIKPFRTIEDLHVTAALLGYLLRIGSLFDWPHPPREQLISLLLSFRTLARADYTAPATHIGVGGALATFQKYLECLQTYWNLVDAETRAAWQRDRTVLDIAAEARARRLTAAWRHLS